MIDKDLGQRVLQYVRANTVSVLWQCFNLVILVVSPERSTGER